MHTFFGELNKESTVHRLLEICLLLQMFGRALSLGVDLQHRSPGLVSISPFTSQ